MAGLFMQKAVPTMRILGRGARVVESGGLENRCSLSGTVGSNPTLYECPSPPASRRVTPHESSPLSVDRYELFRYN